MLSLVPLRCEDTLSKGSQPEVGATNVALRWTIHLTLLLVQVHDSPRRQIKAEWQWSLKIGLCPWLEQLGKPTSSIQGSYRNICK